MATSVDFSKKNLVIITGASQGIGQTIAVELSKCLGNDSVVVLIARSRDGLETTKNLMLKNNDKIVVNVQCLNLAKPTLTELEGLFNLTLDFEAAIIFHNVGHMGTLSKTTELIDLQAWRDYYDLNVFSVGILNTIFYKKLHNVVPRLVVVNITSLIGRQPTPDMAYYGTGKAAREMFFRIFAMEEPDVTVFNYSPGPVDTPMLDFVVDNLTNQDVKSKFVELQKNNGVLTTVQTVTKMLTILKSGDFKSGDTVDYFDRI